MKSPWALCLLLCLLTALSFLDRQVLSILAPTITTELHMGNVAYSHVVFAFLASYTVMFALGGYMVDRLGTSRGLMISLSVWSAASGAHAFATGAFSLGVARFFLGLGEGACFPAVVKGITEWFPLERRVLAIGIANSGSTFGAVLAPPLVVFVAAQVGWRGAFVGTAVLGVLWLAAWAGFRSRIPPREAAGKEAARQGGFWDLARDRFLWRVLSARFLVDQVTYFYMFWIPQYLVKERHFTQTEVGERYWIPFLASGLSGILAGKLSDLLVCRGWRPRRARCVLLTAAALVTPVSWLVALAPNASAAILLMCVVMLAKGVWQTNYLGLLSDSFPVKRLATVTGLSGTAGGIGGMISSLVIGLAVEHFSFRPVFAMVSVVYPVALLLLFAGPRFRVTAGFAPADAEQVG
jgi:ACS family hexuronate transporter-like MFS transporter